jgi:hypothetical protein
VHSLTTRARALRWHRAQLLTGGTRPQHTARPQAAARRYLLLVLLAAAALLLAGPHPFAELRASPFYF